LVLVIAGYTERENIDYRNKLEWYARKKKINCVFLDGAVNGFNPKDRTAKDLPNLLDLYIYADLVTYPSLWEGFGNQFLETVFSKTPIVMFEYPVFKNDIKPKGFKIISLGDQYETNPETGLVKIPTEKIVIAADDAMKILASANQYRKWGEENYLIAKRHYSCKIVSRLFSKIFSTSSSYPISNNGVKNVKSTQNPP